MSRTYLGNDAIALLGAWQQIIGASSKGLMPDDHQHGVHGGRHHRRHWHDGEIGPRNELIDRPGPTRADRVVLPMSSGVSILPNTSAQITSRPQDVAFRPERIVIGQAGTDGGAADWIVNDVKVGNKSQFSQSGDVPGDLFAATTIDSYVSFATVQTAMDFVMLVTYVGTNESGAPFYCAVLGTAAV
jgi:hypothetical protein